jgi:hypothetical protein
VTQGIPSAICNYKSAAKAYAAAASDYCKWVLSLYQAVLCFDKNPHALGAISPSVALWVFQTQCMPTATNGMEYNLEEENAALQVANAIRSQVTGLQNIYNRIINDIEHNISGPSTLAHGTVVTGPKSLAQELEQDLKQFSTLLQNPSLAEIMGSGNLGDLQGYIKNIENLLKGQPGLHQTVSNIFHSKITTYVCHRSRVSIFINPGTGRGWPVHISWVTTYKQTVHTTSHITHKWEEAGGPYSALKSAYSQAVNAGQQVPGVFSDVTSNFSNLNQSVSGVSSYIQTQMNYLNQNLQQFFSVYNNFFSDYNTLNSYIVSKTVGG